MVPGKFINLLPPQITKPKVSAVGRAPAVPVPSSAVPKFTKPDLFIPDNFWSNLKQFLTERPVKVRERKDAPFTQTNFGSGFFGNLAEYLRPGPGGNRPINSRDRKSTRLNSSHGYISYAVFCLTKKKKNIN